MSEGTGVPGSQGPNGAAQGANSQGSQAGAGPAAQGATQQNGNAQGAGTNTADTSGFEARLTELSTKLESALSDNRRYRERLRSIVSDDGDGASNGNANSGQQGQQANGNSAAAEELLNEIRMERATTRLTAAATRAEFVDPDSIMNFINLNEVADAKGAVSKPDDVIAKLKADKPQLFGLTVNGNGDGAAGSRVGSRSGDMNTLIRDRLRGR